mgnify:FL=1
MKTYCIDMDVTFSARMCIEADDLESAKKLAEERMNADPYYHTRNRAWVDTKVTDAWEEGEDD